MAKKIKNQSLGRARDAKQDEFYTQLSDIEKELKHYGPHFKGKKVYCNCDDPRISNFFHYFSYNFKKLNLKKLIATCYKNQVVICSAGMMLNTPSTLNTAETIKRYRRS